MKHPLFILLIPFFLFFFIQCEENGEGSPSSLAGLKKRKAEIKKEMRELEKKLAGIDSAIDVLDTATVRPQRVVTVDTAMQGRFRHFVELQGSVQPKKRIDISAEMSGRLLDVMVEEGDRVRRGQLIAQVDLEGLKNRREELLKQKELAEEIYRRQKSLWERNIGSEVQFLEAKNRLESLEKSIESIDYEISKSRVYSPVSGVVDKVLAEDGELVVPGSPIMQVFDPGSLKAQAEVPEQYLDIINEGDSVWIEFPAVDTSTITLVSHIASTINPRNRTVQVEAELENLPLYIKPNMLISMKFIDYQEDGVITLPGELIQQEVTGANYIYVIDTSKKLPQVMKRKVVTGRSFEGNVKIEEGLKPGEIYVLKGAKNVSEGEYIEITNR